MHGRKGTLFLLAALAACLAAVSAGGALKAQTLGEKVKKFELGNGMTWLVVERSEAPVVFCAVAYDVGAANERPNITGISHMLEHMMFKGTEMMGTKNYKKEIPLIEATDELGERTIRLRREMGEWRFERFHAFAKQVLNAFTEDEKKAIGADKCAQQKMLVSKIRGMNPLPDSIAASPFLVAQEGVDYLEMYLEYETAWGEISRLLDEQRQYMIKEELWDQFMNNGSRFLNAFTSNDFTVYLEYLPANRLELFMNLESDRMESPVFREFWSERDVIMEERRLGENDPDNELGEAFYAAAFTAHPYRWPVVGWMSDIEAWTLDDLKPAYATAADIDEGKRAADGMCASCHGANGISATKGVPHVAGQRQHLGLLHPHLLGRDAQLGLGGQEDRHVLRQRRRRRVETRHHDHRHDRPGRLVVPAEGEPRLRPVDRIPDSLSVLLVRLHEPESPAFARRRHRPAERQR